MIRTVEEKHQALSEKREAERSLGAQIEKQIARAEQETTSCSICNLFGRLVPRPKTQLGAGSTAGAALFGVRQAKSDPNAALQQAVLAMQNRVDHLETRVEEARSEAHRMAREGQKGAALRSLKKAKALEKQLASTQASMFAVEEQQDLLEQATVQQAVAKALSATAKGMKKDKKLLAKAEGAVEDAQEARDLAEDLSSVMQELGSAQEVDEAALMEELEEMMKDPPGGPSASMKETVDSEESRKQEIQELELKINQREAADRVRQSLPAPGKRMPHQEEKQGLLAVA